MVRRPPPTSRIDAAGRCVIPGFVDSHTHLVFAGDRADEFAARMAGEPYTAGGIAITVAATRAAEPTKRSTATVRRLAAEARRSGTTTIEIKSGYGLTVDDELAALVVARAADRRDDVPRRPRRAAGVRRTGRRLRRARVRRDARRACAPHARWIDAFCERGAFDADQCRAVLEAGRAAGLGLRLHANQLGAGPGVQLAVELGCASADHCTYLSDADVDALAGGSTVATFLPATDFSTRQPYPDARRVIDAGVTVALASQLQPGLELHDVDAVLHRPRRARDGDDGRRGGAGGHRRRRRRTAPRRRRQADARVARRPRASSTRRRRSTSSTGPASTRSRPCWSVGDQ